MRITEKLTAQGKDVFHLKQSLDGTLINLNICVSPVTVYNHHYIYSSFCVSASLLGEYIHLSFFQYREEKVPSKQRKLEEPLKVYNLLSLHKQHNRI